MRRLLLVVLAVIAAAGAGGLQWWRTHNIGPVQRGARLAAERGCLACHDPGAHAPDPMANGVGGIPSFSHEDVSQYSHSREEIREWILDGKPRRLQNEPADDPPPLVRMPAWRGRLSAAEVDALVAYLEAVSDFEPVPEQVAAGRTVATRAGCFVCHGPQGRGDTPNPGSLKGYIPSWSGTDFPELAANDDEIREWIKDGSPKRLRENRAAALFMRRQVLKMPAFGDRLTAQETGQLVAYIRWLRQTSATGASSTR